MPKTLHLCKQFLIFQITFLATMGKKKPKFYVVWEGYQTGIFTTWADCQAQIKGYRGARYKSFPTRIQAEEAFYGNSRDYIGQNKSAKRVPSSAEIALVGKPIIPSISVDAACSGNPGALEYQGVDTQSGINLFHAGPFPKGTVNIGEFLALVHGLAMLQEKNSTLPIYSDSRTAMAWVRKKSVNTNLARTHVTERLFKLVDRALLWLKENDYANPILKWETEYWGEIPADFGRK